jgi:hypothetical protein
MPAYCWPSSPPPTPEPKADPAKYAAAGGSFEALARQMKRRPPASLPSVSVGAGTGDEDLPKVACGGGYL